MATGSELDISKPDVSHMVSRCPNEIIEAIAIDFANLRLF